MLTWNMCKAKLRRAIRDVEVSGRALNWSDEDLCDYWTDAQDDLVNYASRKGVFTVPEAATAHPLPEGLYRIVAVKNGDGYSMLQLDATETDDEDLWEGCYWYYEDANLNFTVAVPDSDATVFYEKHYPSPQPGDGGLNMPILVPRWAIRACVMYATAEAVERTMIEDANLRRWAGKQTDSGKPTDNPFIAVAKYYHERYRELVFARVGDNAENSSWPSLSR
jgi:hypothetical protein